MSLFERIGRWIKGQSVSESDSDSVSVCGWDRRSSS